MAREKVTKKCKYLDNENKLKILSPFITNNTLIDYSNPEISNNEPIKTAKTS